MGAKNAKKKKFVRLKIEDFKIEKIRSIFNYVPSESGSVKKLGMDSRLHGNDKMGAKDVKKKKFVRLKIEDFKIEKIRSIFNYVPSESG